MMLKELESILRKNTDITEESLQKAAALLLNSQFIYKSRHGQGNAYRLLERFPDYFSGLVNATGRRLHHDDHACYFGAIPLFRQFTWNKFETILLGILSLCFIDERDKIRLDNGLATVNGGNLIDRYCQLTGNEKPKQQDVSAALDAFSRSGVILLGDKDPSCNLPFIQVSSAVMEILPEEICQGIIGSLEPVEEA